MGGWVWGAEGEGRLTPGGVFHPRDREGLVAGRPNGARRHRRRMQDTKEGEEGSGGGAELEWGARSLRRS